MTSFLLGIKLFYLTMTLLAVTLWAYTADEIAEKLSWFLLVFSVGVVVGAQVGA